MELLITENWKVIKSNDNNFTVEEFREVENKETKEKTKKWVDKGKYFTSLKFAVKYICNQIVFGTDKIYESLEEFEKNSQKVYEDIISQIMLI